MVVSVVNGGRFKVRVFMVERHPIVRLMLKQLLGAQRECDVIGEASDIQTAAVMVQDLRPDLVISESAVLEPGDGLRLAERLRTWDPAPKMLVFTGDSSPEVLSGCLQSQVASYVHKSAEPERLLSAVFRTVRGEQVWIVDDRAPRGSNGVDGLDAVLAGSLTKRESEIFALLVHRCTNEEIAEHLCLAVQTVKNHVRSVFGKVGVTSRAELYRRVGSDAYVM